MKHLSALACLALGALAACGFAPLELWPLALFALAAWLKLVRDAATLRQALWRGWLFGVGHFTVNNNWIQHAFDYQDAMPPVLGYGAVVALALYLAVYPMLAAGLVWRFGRGPALAPVAGAAWIAAEWLRAGLFTGYAWDPLAVIWVPTVVAYLAAWVGTYALSGLTVAAAAGLLALAERRWRESAAVLAPSALIVLAASATVATPRASGSARIRVVQPNLGQETRDDEDYEYRNFTALARLSGEPGPAPRLLVWPEGAITGFIEDGYPRGYYWHGRPAAIRRALADLLGPRDVLLAGGTALAFDRAGELTTAANTIFAVDARARIRGRYDKAHLVPYGEYLPMRPILSRLGLARLVPGDMDFADGPGPRGITVPGFGLIGMQICYEIIFSGQVVDPAHRPRLLFNPSNDAWFGSWGPPQHLAQARMRAIEEGLPILRSTPTGISAVIDARGRLLGSVGLGRAGAIELAVPQPLPPTPFAWAGNWLALLVGTALVASAVAIRRRGG